MEKSPDETEQSKEEFAKEILMRLLARVCNDINASGTRILLNEALGELDEL